MSTETRIQQYEAMYLFPQSATADLESAVTHVREPLERHGATLVSLAKWDERKLAYDVAGNRRGVYFLVYFTAPTTALHAIERDYTLSERLLRFMIVRADELTPEQMNDADGQAKLVIEMKLRGQPSHTGEGETVPAAIMEA
ncbi:MAG: 30S ribosomal protein S6 [Planctomycetota bacterium]|nr:30S ribosomal protein S6 [Planctomycetota bacterium]MDA1106024.1 30S ribosomal protein S6 [Planctomycetota bacterium]